MTTSLETPDVVLQSEPKSNQGRRGVSWIGAWILIGAAAAVLASLAVIAAHGQRGAFLPALAAIVCVVAAFTDARTGRIPNPLTYTAILLGLGLNCILPELRMTSLNAAAIWLGGAGPTSSLMGFGACAVLGLIGSFIGGVHGGDLKLLGTMGAMLGLVDVANALLIALLLAIVYAVINLIFLGRLTVALRMMANRMLELRYLRRFQTPLPDDPAPADPLHFPMAVPLAIGVLLAQYWQWRVGTGGGGFIL